MSRRRRSEVTILSQHQAERVLKACLDMTDRLVIGLALFLGMRPSEIVHLNASWITEDGNLRISDRMSCNCAECMRKRGGTWKPKGRSGARTLPIPKRLRKDLATLLKMQPYGLGMSRVGLYYRVQNVGQRAKVKGLSPEDLRATCLAMLKERGIEVRAFCYFAGIKSIGVGNIAEAKSTALREVSAVFG